MRRLPKPWLAQWLSCRIPRSYRCGGSAGLSPASQFSPLALRAFRAPRTPNVAECHESHKRQNAAVTKKCSDCPARQKLRFRGQVCFEQRTGCQHGRHRPDHPRRFGFFSSIQPSRLNLASSWQKYPKSEAGRLALQNGISSAPVTNRATIFFVPDFSKSISSLSPSMATINP